MNPRERLLPAFGPLKGRALFRVLSLLFGMVLVGDAVASTCRTFADVYFPDRSVRTSDAEMQKALQALRRVRAGDVVAVIIVGHAAPDEVADRQLLSQARAGTVLAYLLSQEPALAARLTTQAVAGSQPVAPPSRPDLNRRVELEVECVVPPPYELTAKPTQK